MLLLTYPLACAWRVLIRMGGMRWVDFDMCSRISSVYWTIYSTRASVWNLSPISDIAGYEITLFWYNEWRQVFQFLKKPISKNIDWTVAPKFNRMPQIGTECIRVDLPCVRTGESLHRWVSIARWNIWTVTDKPCVRTGVSSTLIRVEFLRWCWFVKFLLRETSDHNVSLSTTWVFEFKNMFRITEF